MWARISYEHRWPRISYLQKIFHNLQRFGASSSAFSQWTSGASPHLCVFPFAGHLQKRILATCPVKLNDKSALTTGFRVVFHCSTGQRFGNKSRQVCTCVVANRPCMHREQTSKLGKETILNLYRTKTHETNVRHVCQDQTLENYFWVKEPLHH